MNLFRRLSRILSPSRWLVLALVAPAHAALGIQAWYGSKFAIGMMVAFLYFWSIMAVLSGNAWGQALQRWKQSLDGWQETTRMAGDYGRLLGEAIDGLSTWDREKAEDINQRANTVALMRAQNVREKMDE